MRPGPLAAFFLWHSTCYCRAEETAWCRPLQVSNVGLEKQRLAVAMEGKMENGAAEADDAEPASSETLVLDDDATEYHEHLHVHFAPGQLSLGAHHIGDYMPPTSGP